MAVSCPSIENSDPPTVEIMARIGFANVLLSGLLCLGVRHRSDRQREQQTTRRGTFVLLHFDPGEAFQFDWSEDFPVLGCERTKLQMAHTKLSNSRALLL